MTRDEGDVQTAAREERLLFEAIAWPMGIIALGVALVLWHFGLSVAPLTGVVISGVVFVVTLLLVWVGRRGLVRLATTAFSVLLLAFTATITVVWGGSSSPNVMIFGVAILVAGLLRGWLLAFVFGCVSVALVWAIVGAELLGWAPVYPVFDDPAASAVLVTGYLLCIAVYLGMALRQRSNALAAERMAMARAAERETQLLEARRLESIGRLAGGIAHDFGNLLTVILGNASVVSDDPATSGRARELVYQIREAGERGAELTRQLLAIARRQVTEPRVVDLAIVSKSLESLLRRLIREDVSLRFLFGPGALPIRIDPVQLEQVVVNLALNAADAMPEGGDLTVEASAVELDEAYAAAHAGASVGMHVVLAVSDTGVGMEAVTVQQVFEPFFTTKGNQHSGLGLATVHGIVKQAGGHVFVYSEPGRGTTVKVYLPRANSAPAPAAAPETTRTLPKGLTVLVVDDEPLVRHTTSLILESFGCRVLAAGGGAEALERAASCDGPIHLLVSDVVMPGMSGRQIAVALRRERPELRVLYVSGYAENAIVHHGELDEGLNFLGKPFVPGALLEKLEAILKGPVGGC